MPVSLSPAPVAAYNITSPAYCPGQNIVFTDASTVGAPGKIDKWAWNFGNGGTSANQSPFIAYTTAGDYTVTLTTTTNHNCAVTATQILTIFTNPTITISPDIFIYAGTPYQQSPAYTGTGLTYAWTPSTYLDNPAIDSPFTTADKDITYNILVMGEGGCQVSSNVNMHVVSVLKVPNAFSPNGDGVNDKWIIENIQGYPDCTVKVFNRYGQAVFSSTGYSKPWDGTLNGTPLPVGTYYYIIDTRSDKFAGTHGDVTILR